MRGLVIVCCVAALSACSKTEPASEPVEEAPAASGAREDASRARAVEAARAAGIAALEPGSDVAGPYLGASGELTYADGQGRVSMYEARTSSLTLALRNPPRVVFKVTPEGAYEMDGGVLDPIDRVPDEAARYPHVGALMARVIEATKARVEEKREARERVAPMPLPASWLSDAPEASDIGEEDCEDHHVDGFFVGCY